VLASPRRPVVEWKDETTTQLLRDPFQRAHTVHDWVAARSTTAIIESAWRCCVNYGDSLSLQSSTMLVRRKCDGQSSRPLLPERNTPVRRLAMILITAIATLLMLAVGMPTATAAPD
jgi:hypothetical protein